MHERSLRAAAEPVRSKTHIYRKAPERSAGLTGRGTPPSGGSVSGAGRSAGGRHVALGFVIQTATVSPG